MEKDFVAWLKEQFALTPTHRAADITRLTGISPGYISALRSGIKGKPSVGTAEAIARAFAGVRKLNVDETRLLCEEGLRFAIGVRRHKVQAHRLVKLSPPPYLHGFDLMVWRAQNQQCICGHPM